MKKLAALLFGATLLTSAPAMAASVQVGAYIDGLSIQYRDSGRYHDQYYDRYYGPYYSGYREVHYYRPYHEDYYWREPTVVYYGSHDRHSGRHRGHGRGHQHQHDRHCRH